MLLSDKEYLQLKNYPRFKIGQTKLLGREFFFPDNYGYLHSLEEIFRDEVYRFNSKKPDPFIIDAGANMGLSIAYFKQLYPDAKIVAFEPDPNIYKLLQQNINSLGYNEIDLRNTAAWNDDTTLTFFSEGSLAGSTEINLTKAGSPLTVKAERLKNWLLTNQVDFLKIDIEGAENTVLFDLADALHRVEHLFLEYHSLVGKEQMLGEILTIIKKAGFRYYIKSALNTLRFPFTQRIKKGFDMQLNIFCYRD